MIRLHRHPLLDIVLRRGLIIAIILSCIYSEPKYVEQIKKELENWGFILSRSSVAQRIIFMRTVGLIKKAGKKKLSSKRECDLYIATQKGRLLLKDLIRWVEDVLGKIKRGIESGKEAQ